MLLHGWPYDIHGYAEVTPLLAAAGLPGRSSRISAASARRVSSRSETLRNGEQAALALDVIALMDALEIEKAIVAGFDWGARTADIVAAHGPSVARGSSPSAAT